MRLQLGALLALVFAVTAARAFADQLQSLRSQMAAARNTLVQHYQKVQKLSGIAGDLVARLDSDDVVLLAGDRPAWITESQFDDYAALLIRLDGALVEQLSSGVYHPLSQVRGADDTVYKTPADNTLQPLGVYVPASYAATKPASLVVFLHGKTQSENSVIASPWIRAAADSTGSIVIAPYARGDSEYADPAWIDVYAALDAAKKVFNVDARRIYLAGHSMGGFGVFVVGPKKPQTWAAIMAVAGGMTDDDKPLVLQSLRSVPIFLVVGSNDQVVPPSFMKRNENVLMAGGLDTHYYEQPGGQHSIGTVRDAFYRAWKDMLARSR